MYLNILCGFGSEAACHWICSTENLERLLSFAVLEKVGPRQIVAACKARVPTQAKPFKFLDSRTTINYLSVWALGVHSF